MNIALTGRTSYHLGSLIARRLSNRGPIFGGTIALRVLTHLGLPLDPNDVPLTPRRLDIAAMKSHHFVTTDSTLDNMVYRMLFADGDEKEIPLPQPGLFNIDSMTPRTPSPPTTTPSRTRVLLLAHTWNMIHLRRTTEILPHGLDGIELHLGQKPKLGGGIPASLILCILWLLDTCIYLFSFFKWFSNKRGMIFGEVLPENRFWAVTKKILKTSQNVILRSQFLCIFPRLLSNFH